MSPDDLDPKKEPESVPGGAEPPVPPPEDAAPHPLKEIVQPFIDLVHAGRALWAVNSTYFIEGIVYFGWLTLLAIFFNNFVGLNDLHADWMVSVLTAGITLAMLFFGGVADKIGVRRALLIAFFLMFVGRFIIVGSLKIFPLNQGWGSPLFYACLLGLLGVVLGYGLYQPAAYTAIREFCDERTSAMGYAMLYAVMNLGAAVPGFISPPVRHAFGIPGVFWLYVGLTALSFILVLVLLTKRVQKRALDVVAEYRRVHEQEGVEKDKKQLEEAKEAKAKLKGSKKYLMLNWLQGALLVISLSAIAGGLVFFLVTLVKLHQYIVQGAVIF
ncbi:MAG: MFS transporter, partial [Acidobacteriota bacterium]